MAIRLPVAARRWASLPIRGVPVRIRSGPNAGRRWSLAASGRGIWSGAYERERFEALATLLGDNDVFWDVGAHRGYATLLADDVIGPEGSIHAFEPSTVNRGYLAQHLRWNGADRVDVHRSALADFDGTAEFGGTGSSVSHKLVGAPPGEPAATGTADPSSAGSSIESVPVRTISNLVEGGVPAPTFLKIDVEGEESGVLAGARQLLDDLGKDGTQMPVILVSVHSGPQLTACLDFLRGFDYQVLGSSSMSTFMQMPTEAWYEDPDLFAVPRRGRIDLSTVRGTAWFRGGPDLSTQTKDRP
ncbi:MAG: FkbM family methyltransferase [Gemmatimonadota bacterium]